MQKITNYKNKIYVSIIFIGIIITFAEILKTMVRLETYEGILLSTEDSREYIIFMMKECFENFSEFLNCEGIKSSYFWGDSCLLGTDGEYREWITQIARQILKK